MFPRISLKHYVYCAIIDVITWVLLEFEFLQNELALDLIQTENKE